MGLEGRVRAVELYFCKETSSCLLGKDSTLQVTEQQLVLPYTSETESGVRFLFIILFVFKTPVGNKTSNYTVPLVNFV